MNSVIKNGDNVDFKVDAGSTWVVNLTWTQNDGTPIDLGGFTGRMYLKRNYNATAALMLTTENGRMTFNMGSIILSLDDETTGTLSGSYLYDIEIQSYLGEVTRLFQGTFVVSPEVTK